MCVCVCRPPRLLITSGVMWRDMDPMRLVKQVLQLYMATVVVIVSGWPWNWYSLYTLTP